MTAWPSVFSSFTIQNTSLVTTAETVIAQVAVTDDSVAAVAMLGLAVITTGTGATSVTLRIRADSLTGTQVATSGPVTATAGNTAPFLVFGAPAAQEMPGRLFVVTAAQGAATANGVVVAAGLVCLPQF